MLTQLMCMAGRMMSQIHRSVPIAHTLYPAQALLAAQSSKPC